VAWQYCFLPVYRTARLFDKGSDLAPISISLVRQ
jgi:hypothetical protein